SSTSPSITRPRGGVWRVSDMAVERPIGQGVTVRHWCWAVAAVVCASLLLPSARASAPGACLRTAMPYRGLAGAALVPTDYVSKDVPPVRYTRWRGTVPGFDGMPFSVDVTVPCGSTGRQPTVVMAHGFTDDKTIWEETGKSDTVLSTSRPATNSH